ncbi:MAG TPA: hypothetical protein VGJ28_18590 [Micromonosporaceae bacterium]|jgi:hypothetical protein
MAFEKVRHAGDPRIKLAVRRYRWLLLGLYVLGLIAGGIVGYLIAPGLIGTVLGVLFGAIAMMLAMWMTLPFVLHHLRTLDSHLDRAA